MSHLSLILSVVLIDLVALISPGPNFLAVSQTAMHRSRSYAAAMALGIATGSLIWCAAVAFGLSALFVLMPELYAAIKILGGLYLVYLGIRLWLSPGAASAAATQTGRGSLGEGYGRGLLINLTNPKSAAYYGSIFALLLGPGMPVWVQAMAIGLVSLNSVLWHGAVALLFSTEAVQRGYAALRRPINRLCGAVMVAFGAKLLLVRD